MIALALEKIRRPEAFFAAAARALRAGKPVMALKLGRTERGRVMTQSHTGTVTGDAWVYDVAFRQAGIDVALEVDELVDRLQFLEQLPTAKWTALRGPRRPDRHGRIRHDDGRHLPGGVDRRPRDP